ncbi:MAG: cellulase family glycosylhydrolase [Actinopolymorphaceae bacterium]
MSRRVSRKDVLRAMALASAGALGDVLPGAAHAANAADATATAPAGLTVAIGGVLLLDGRPFRGIGVNYLDAFYRLLLVPEPGPDDIARVRAGMEALAGYGIPFARIMGCGYWPVENRLYFDDKTEYLRRFATVVDLAEETGVGLIPSLFWHTATATDLMDEPRNQWQAPASRTHAFLRGYVRDVVRAFVGSPAIWAWEFGNEYNLDADLPNASDWRPPVVPELGTRLSRDERDDLTHEQIHTAFRAFAGEVRRHDPRRIILSGNAAPRPSAWHQREYLSWDQDSRQEFAEILRYENPDPLDALSVHQYATVEQRFGTHVNVADFLQVCVRESRKARKPLFVGEFGADEMAGHEVAAAGFDELLDAIVTTGVPLAALWVYDFAGQDGTWNVTPDNGRQYQLEAIAEANQRLRPAATTIP